MVRVRFCPSPTGLLHIGGVHTALFNWLFARHEGGVLVLRIEDTDETREHPEAIDQIQRALRWIGLDWDEGPDVGGPHGPYIQSERRARHHEVADELLARERAYRCWCTADELAAERTAAQKENRPPVYSRRCLRRSEAERERLLAEGRPFALRFHVDDAGSSTIDDLVRGVVTWQNALIGDQVIVRSDGVPTYNFVNPVDDHDMRITHVVRGEDLMPSTPRQLQLWHAMGWEPPRYAHLGLLLGPDRKRFSKRHGAASVEGFRDAGYVREALVNFLALLGWRDDETRELYTLSELVEVFTLARVSPAPSVLDLAKLEWMNGVYLRALEPADYAERLLGYLTEQGSPLAREPAVVRAAAPLVQEKLQTFGEFAGYCDFLFDGFERDPDAWAKVSADPATPAILAAAREALAACEWTPEAIEAAIRDLPARLGAKPRAVFGALRVAVTGRTVSPGLFESIHLLGREAALARL